MKLEEIGFYTLTDHRARIANIYSNLHRCELILTDRCNFNCTYCRGIDEKYSFTPLEKACEIVNMWSEDGLKNIRFSGGEPTLYDGISNLIALSKSNGIERIALSTNGSADFQLYEWLIRLGLNDISISLDSCCSLTFNKMCGIGESNMFEKVFDNIKKLSKLTYVTIGMVINENNLDSLNLLIGRMSETNVSDIRIVPSAQYSSKLNIIKRIIPKYVKYPILKYRIENYLSQRNIRGIYKDDYNKCPLVLDDMAVANGFHFPCIIYFREGGNPIGYYYDRVKSRKERYDWYKSHNTSEDFICKNNCLDVCVDYNNKWRCFQS